MAIFNLGLKPPPPVKERAVTDDQHWQDPRFADAPELVPGTGPELVPGMAPEVVHSPLEWSQLEKASDDGLSGAASPESKPKPWWKRKLIVIGIILVVLLIVGLAVGLGVSMSKKHQDSDAAPSPSTNGTEDGSAGSNGNDNSTGNSNNSTSTPEDQDDGTSNGKEVETGGGGSGNASKSPCQGGLCQNVFSLTIHESVLFVFGRTLGNRLAMKTLNDTSWDKFTDLGESPESMLSQPSSFSWKVHINIGFPRLDLWTVGGDNNTAYRRHFTNVEGWTAWEAEGEDIGSSIAICGPYPHKMDVWSTARSDQRIYHDWWYQYPDEEIGKGLKDGNTTKHGKMSAGENGWLKENDLGRAKSAPAVVCRDSNVQADVLWYDRTTSKLTHSSWELTTEWSSSTTFDGDFIGNPTVVSFDKDEWDFFGVQSDNKLYHLSWKAGKTGYSKLNNLGGSLISAPTIVSLGDNKMDVIALGTDGNLQRMYFDGSDWADKWENLEISARSAPSAIVYKNLLYILAVTEKNTIMALSRDAKFATSWKDSLRKEDLSGKMTVDGFHY